MASGPPGLSEPVRITSWALPTTQGVLHSTAEETSHVTHTAPGGRVAIGTQKAGLQSHLLDITSPQVAWALSMPPGDGKVSLGTVNIWNLPPGNRLHNERGKPSPGLKVNVWRHTPPQSPRGDGKCSVLGQFQWQAAPGGRPPHPAGLDTSACAEQWAGTQLAPVELVSLQQRNK